MADPDQPDRRDTPPSRARGETPRPRSEEEADGTPRDEQEGAGESGKGPSHKREERKGGYTDGTPEEPAQNPDPEQQRRDDAASRRQSGLGPAREKRERT